MAHIPPDGVVLFDAVGTLLRPEPAVADAYAAVGARFGSQLSRTAIDGRFRTIFSADKATDQREHEGRTDEPRERERWRAIVAGVFDDVAESRHDELFEELWNHFAQPASWRTFDDVPATLARLAATGRTLAIASNFDRRLLGIAAALVPEIPPERVFVSSLLGYRKPAPGFFDACRRKLTAIGFATDKLTLVGDDLDEDFHGATAAGWNAILLDREGRRPEIAARIGRLESLV